MNDDILCSSLVPQPREVTFQEGRLALDPAGPIAADFDQPERFAYLLGLCGQNGQVEVRRSADAAPAGLHLTIGHVDPSEATGLEPKFNGTDAYALRIGARGIELASREPSGMAMGLKTLAKLIFGRHDLPTMTIQDAPVVDFRGLHLCIFRPDDGTEKEATDPQSIRDMLLLAAMSGYSYVFLEFWGMFPYTRRPYAVWPNGLYGQEVVREIIRYALEDLHITPLPCQNLTSHAGWSRMVSRKHVVLDQRPDLADMWMQGGWCYATENPDTRAFLRDVIEELLDVYRQPPLLHAGCDKAFGFGFGGPESGKSADLIFGDHLNFLNEVLQRHGTRMVIWADMLHTSMDAMYWKADPRLVDMLPRNILMNIWTHNDPGEHWADVDFFESRGFQTVYSPFLDRQGVANMVRTCLSHASHGIVQTTWHRPQTARTAVVFSGACQWQGTPPHDLDADAFVSRWYGGVVNPLLGTKRCKAP